jgi:hypothetical protein
MTYILPGNLTKLDPFTLRMMEDVLKDHATATDHDGGFCCQVAGQYKIRVEAHYSIVADEKAAQGTSAVENPISVPQRDYITGLAKKCPQHLLSPEMREQVAKVLKHEEISYEAASAIIDCMKAVVDGPSVPKQRDNVRLATPAMIGFLRKLLSQREHNEKVDITALELLPFKAASEMIDRLKVAPFKGKDGKKAQLPTEGVYFVDGVYFKVQKAKANGSGNVYAKRFDSQTSEFVYVGREPFALLTEDKKVTEEQAAQFGALYGKCCNCGRTLTDEYSIEHGYGRICAEKMGF